MLSYFGSPLDGITDSWHELEALSENIGGINPRSLARNLSTVGLDNSASDRLKATVMERVRKTFFNPLATSKSEVIRILEDLPVGSAHPFSPEKLLLCRTDNDIKEIDISEYPENFFFNAVDLGEMGEVLLNRMARFEQLSKSSLPNLLFIETRELCADHIQRYSKTSKSCKHRTRHSRSPSFQTK